MFYNCFKSVKPKGRTIMLLEMFAYVDDVDEAAAFCQITEKGWIKK